MRKAASEFSAMPVHISHIGVFAGGKVLFGAVEKSAELVSLRDACETGVNGKYPWIPHVTVLIDEPDAVCAALPVLVRSFHPIVASIAKLHLCAFWPMREIASVKLNGG